MHSLLFLSVLSISAASPNAQSAARCKAVPDTAEWPSNQAWERLKTAVGGRLLKPDPPAAACHTKHPAYNMLKCLSVKVGFSDTLWHSKHPTSNLWQNYNNYSCMPDSKAGCTNGGYPIYVVAAKTPQDVKAAVDFARTNNIRLNIKSTGHDFLGRSVQPNSLSIWTHKLKDTEWFKKSFTPRGCNFSIDAPAVTVGSGTQWRDLSLPAKLRGLALVSGAYGTVSVGGYLANGGHGELSAKYGLGADMVLQIELVTAAGEIITANECQNQDYFWAMRGGGGSTYGVALSYTLQAIKTVRTARYTGIAWGWDQITALHSQWPKLAMAGASGYFVGYPGLLTVVGFTITLPNATSSELRHLVQPMVAVIRGRVQPERITAVDPDQDKILKENPFFPAAGNYTEFATWGEAQDSPYIRSEKTEFSLVPNMFPGVGNNKIVVSWLWNAKHVQHPNLKNALQEALAGSGMQMTYLNDATMGAGTHNPPYIRGGGNAVNPAFRTAIMRPAAEMQWLGSDMTTLAENKAKAQRYGAALRSVAPGGGTYANEADPDVPDWQHAFWGTNYERLLQIKKKVDPLGLFYCRACVGSELFTDNAGVLCRV